MNAPAPPPDTGLPAAGPLAFGPFVLDEAQARLTQDGVPVALNGRPLAVLALLAAHPQQLLSKDEVLDAVWGHRHVTESVLKVAINSLRVALNEDAKAPQYVQTVARRGYRFIADVFPVAAVPALPALPTLPAAVPVNGSSAVKGPGAGAGSAAGNLPPAALGLVGRESEAAALTVSLHSSRLVTLTGLGGVGKTCLALAVAAPQPPANGAWIVRLDDLHDPALLVPTLAQTLLLGASAGADAAALGRALQPLHMRVLLDNAEHLIAAVAALVATLLAAAPGLQLLVTSQLPLRVAGEQVHLLAPLGLPDDWADSAPPPESYAAAQLFCARIAQQLPGWSPSAEDRHHVAAICRALDGVPLALELAAARVPLLGVAGVRSRLDQRFVLLTRAPRDAAARHRTLVAALEWTFTLLLPAEQSALQRLAVFAGSFTAEAAEAVLSPSAAAAQVDALDLVDTLRERSLLVVDPGVSAAASSAATPAPAGLRLRLFDSVRRFALDRLAAAGEEGDARGHHLAWMRQRFELADAADFSTPQLQWLADTRADIDNLRAALRHGLQETAAPGERDDAQRLMAASAVFWYRSGNRREGLAWLQQAQALTAQPRTRALLDHACGVFGMYAQNIPPQQALDALRQSRPLLDRPEDRQRVFHSWYCDLMLSFRLQPQGDRQRHMQPQLDAMRRLAPPQAGPLAQRHLLMAQATVQRAGGELEAYLQTSSRMAAGCRAIGALAESWSSDNGVAQALVMLGRWDEAAALLTQTLTEYGLPACCASRCLWWPLRPACSCVAAAALRRWRWAAKRCACCGPTAWCGGWPTRCPGWPGTKGAMPMPRACKPGQTSWCASGKTSAAIFLKLSEPT